MATANFRNHENGIYVLEMATEEQAREMLLHEYDDEEITEDMVTSAIYNDYEWLVEGFLSEILTPALEEKGYWVEEVNNYTITVWSCKNYNDRVVAEIRLEDGYYSHVQVIIETNQDYLIDKYINYGVWTQEDIRGCYTPHHKKVLKLVEKYTNKLEVIGSFSNGETFYKGV